MLGKELKEYGKLFDENGLSIMHFNVQKKGNIKAHNHPGKTILFNVVSGKIDVFLNETEKHTMEPNNILKFDGENTISAMALEDTEVFVYLLENK